MQWRPAPNNTGGNRTVDGADGEVVVEQGPDWVVDLLYSPPDWLFPLVVAVVALALAGAALAVHRHGEAVLEDASSEMARNGAIVVGVIACTKASMAWLSLGYVGDVLFGWLVGSAAGILVATAFDRATA